MDTCSGPIRRLSQSTCSHLMIKALQLYWAKMSVLQNWFFYPLRGEYNYLFKCPLSIITIFNIFYILVRFMFWINEGLGDRVTLERSWMDGSDRSTLVVLTAQFAHSLTADVAARRLYWISDSKRVSSGKKQFRMIFVPFWGYFGNSTKL